MSKRTPNDADRRKDRLVDPEDSGHFDPALATDPYGVPTFHTHVDKTTAITLEHAHPFDGPHEHADDPRTDAFGRVTDYPIDDLPAVPPSDVQAADPPATPDVSGETPETSHTPDVAAGSGGRVGRPSPDDQAVERIQFVPVTPPARRSIGTVITHTAMDAASRVPVEVQDERAHAREAVEILIVATAEQHSRNQLMPAERLLDLEAIVQHMVGARGLRQVAATHGIDLDGGDES